MSVPVGYFNGVFDGRLTDMIAHLFNSLEVINIQDSRGSERLTEETLFVLAKEALFRQIL